MASKDIERWMWSEACEMLMRAERLHRQLFQPRGATYHAAAWEPPADVFETEGQVVIYVALPGVKPDHVELAIENGELIVSGARLMPDELCRAAVHRMELPQGRFMRRIPLPRGAYDQIAKTAQDGCVCISLRKYA
jgi:HSP20 family molecular chaperone IbpA